MARYLFQMRTEEVNYEMNSKIREQVSKYLSYINIQDLNFKNDLRNENLVSVSIVYSIAPSARLIIADFMVSLSSL